ncbi:MAG: transporter, family, multidrug resistance protein [Thermoanaerobacterium sp.]|nr:transporter, family, multidrug resistance protein [Thermoanaerobacterium sp.]
MEDILIEQKNTAKKTQKYLGEKGFVLFIAFLSAFIPLSTDAYLPALPRMVESLNTTASMINLTLVLFFIFYAVGTLFWGPLSDKYGRRPILIIGLSIYTAASILCIFSSSVYTLILYRILQSIGCGSATAVSTAIIKDLYSGKKRVRILAITQTIATTSPIVSPVIGAFILSVFSWRGVFIVFSIIGVISVAGSLAMEETISFRSEGSIFHAIGRLGAIAKNKSFRCLLLTFALLNIAFMSFITGSSYIYVNGFGVSEKVYSYYFSVNAVFLLLGPMVYIRLSKYFHYKTIINAAYIVITISGLLLITIGNLGPIVFCLSLIPASLFGNILGPPRTNLMIEQVHGDIGAASSLIGFTFTLFGSIGMVIISTDFVNRVVLIGALYFTIGIVSLVLWSIVSKKPYVKHI